MAEDLDRLLQLGCRAQWANTTNDDSKVLLCGTLDDYVVGFAAAHCKGSTVRVDALFVEEPAREVGVGESLLNAIVAWASSQNMGAIDIDASPGDRQTKSLCERMGFKARLITMQRLVSEQGN